MNKQYLVAKLGQPYKEIINNDWQKEDYYYLLNKKEVTFHLNKKSNSIYLASINREEEEKLSLGMLCENKKDFFKVLGNIYGN